MAGITSLGIGSGLDLQSLVDQLVKVERQPAENRINRNQMSAQTKLSALGSLKSAIDKLNSAAKGLDGASVGLKAGTADEAIVTAAVSGETVATHYQLQVSQLVSAQSLASDLFSSPTEALGTGTFTLRVGEDAAVIALDAGANTLDDLRAAINDSDLNVQAVVVRDGEQYRLLLTSGESGSAGAVSLEPGAGLDPRIDSAQMQITAEARDAVFRVNGLELTASSNTVDDVIPGLTLTLRAVTEGDSAVAVTVEPDRGGLRSKLDDFVKAYNGLIDNMNASGMVSPAGGSAGPLVGDATLRSLQSRLSGAMSNRIDTGAEDASFSMLLDIGFSTNVAGKISIDSAKLDAALDLDDQGVESLVSAFGVAIGSTLASFSGDDGVLDSRTDALNAQIKKLTTEREALDRRMEHVEERLRAQFSALDTMLAQFQSTSTYLAQQLSSIANLTPGG